MPSKYTGKYPMARKSLYGHHGKKNKKFSPRERYCFHSKREEAMYYDSSSYSSQYLSESESFEPDRKFDIDALLDDKWVDNWDDESKKWVRERLFQIAWKDSACQITWEREQQLVRDGCQDLIDAYLLRPENRTYKSPSEKSLIKANKEELEYEKKRRSNDNSKKRNKYREALKKELLNLAPHEDFKLPGHEIALSCIKRLRSSSSKKKTNNKSKVSSTALESESSISSSESSFSSFSWQSSSSHRNTTKNKEKKNNASVDNTEESQQHETLEKTQKANYSTEEEEEAEKAGKEEANHDEPVNTKLKRNTPTIEQISELLFDGLNNGNNPNNNNTIVSNPLTVAPQDLHLISSPSTSTFSPQEVVSAEIRMEDDVDCEQEQEEQQQQQQQSEIFESIENTLNSPVFSTPEDNQIQNAVIQPVAITEGWKSKRVRKAPAKLLSPSWEVPQNGKRRKIVK